MGGGKVFGDDHLDDPDPENKTRKLAEAAVKAGIVDIEKACDIGKSGTELTDDKLYAAVRAGSSLPAGQYVAESMMPKPDPSTPGRTGRRILSKPFGTCLSSAPRGQQSASASSWPSTRKRDSARRWIAWQQIPRS